MTRRTVREAYEAVRPDENAKKRMLDNILSETGGNSSIGKDTHMKKQSFGKLLLIAAIIALMACTVATASELLRIPVKETASFVSHDGTIEFYMDLDEEVYGEVVPSVEVEPHFLTGEEAKHIANVLFGEIEAYENEPFDVITYSKDEIRRKLDRWGKYTTVDALLDLFPEKADEETYLNEAAEVVNKFIERYSQMYADAPEGFTHTLCDWTFKSAHVYMYPEDEWDEHDPNDFNQEVSVRFEIDGIPYSFGASQRNDETFRVNNIHACIYSGISPYNIDEQIFRAQLLRTAEPTEEQILAVKQKAENWLSQMQMGYWSVDECFVSSSGAGENMEYTIHVNAVPVFNGIPAIRRDQLTALRGREEGVTYYYYTDVEFEFSANGDLIYFSMKSPVDMVETSGGAEAISMKDLIELAKENLMESTASNYSYIPTAYAGMLDVGCRIRVTDIDYSLTRMTDVDDRTPFEYSLGISLSGSVEYYDKETGDVLDVTENRILLVLDAVDGAFVGRG